MTIRSDLIEYDGEPLPAPKFWTPRDPAFDTRGPRQRTWSKVWLGRDLMPWQRLVLDVAGEVDEFGLPRYGLVICTVQRQAGKSHLSFTKTGERCFSSAKYRAWYTAQTGADARDQFLKFDEEHIDGTPLRRFVTTLRGNGHEVMRFANKSTVRPHPPTEAALHGKQSDTNDIDEGWAFDLEQGKSLLQATGPTGLTRPHSQTWVWSAGGTASSTWLAELVARGRSGEPGLAYFEWGIPDDLDLDDLEAIASFHPAYGHTIDVRAIRKLRTLLADDAEFARAAGNRWTEAIGSAIKGDLWRGRQTTDPIPEEVQVAYGAARAADGSEVVLAAAALMPDGSVLCEVVEVIPGAYAAASVLAEWLDGEAVAVNPTGPSASLVENLENADVQVVPVGGRDAAAGVTNLLDALDAGAYRFRPHAALDSAVKVAGTRRVGDGGRAWAVVASGASIAALEAVTWAAWAVKGHVPEAEEPARDRWSAA